MIRGLQYLTHIRLYIENVVGIVAGFQGDPREAHYVVVKRIFRYLKGTSKFGLWYDRSNDFTLSAYTNANCTRNMDDRKSTSGGALFLGGRQASWLSKKQDFTSQTTSKVEYVVLVKNYNQSNLSFKETIIKSYGSSI